MKIIEGLQQGSDQWLEWRRQHISAADAASILALNPYRTALEVWEEKVLGWQQPKTAAMQRGNDLEESARAAYQYLTKLLVKPCVGESEYIPYISASFDGMTEDFRQAVEIKCGKMAYKLAHSGQKPPIYYRVQMQHQMFVSGLYEIDYFCFDGRYGILTKEFRDPDFISQMLEIYKEFWENLTKGVPPNETRPNFNDLAYVFIGPNERRSFRRY